jgi:hypothetical protein
MKINIEYLQLQALNFQVKNLDCAVDPEYAELKNCSVKSLETFNVDINIVFIKEVTKLMVRSNWICYC